MDYPFEVEVEVSYEYRMIVFGKSKEDVEEIAREFDTELESWGYIPDYDVYVREMDKKKISSVLQTEGDDIIAFKDGGWMSATEAFKEILVIKPEIEGQQSLI